MRFSDLICGNEPFCEDLPKQWHENTRGSLFIGGHAYRHKHTGALAMNLGYRKWAAVGFPLESQQIGHKDM